MSLQKSAEVLGLLAVLGHWDGFFLNYKSPFIAESEEE